MRMLQVLVHLLGLKVEYSIHCDYGSTTQNTLLQSYWQQER